MQIAQADYDRIVKGLNPGQKTAVTAPEDAVLVVAGAGVGKTTVAVRRIALYVASGVSPEKILAMTFGNKAARETKNRVSEFIPDGKKIHSYTYHAFALREVIQPNQRNDYFKSLGFSGYLNLIDEKDSATFLREAKEQVPGLKEAFKILEVKPKRVDSLLTYHRAYGKRASDFLEELKNAEVVLNEGKVGTLGGVSVYLDRIVKHLGEVKEPRADAVESLINFSKNNRVVIDYLIGILWMQYESVCQKNNGVDFDDILILASRLVQSSPEVRDVLTDKFSHFVLDEFQDTNKVQFDLFNNIFSSFKELGKGEPNLFYVGDTRQAIYRFRGADSKYMSQMSDIRPGIRVLSLTENYRSSKQILNTANAHARTMSDHLTDGCLDSGTGQNAVLPDYVRFETADDEANHIATEISVRINAGTKPSDIAILYRTAPVKGDLERALSKQGIPYVVIGDASFYDSKEISDTISFLRMITRPTDHLATSRVVDCFKGVTGFWYRNQVGQMTNMQFFEKQAHLFTNKSKPFQLLYEKLLPIKNQAHCFSIRETALALFQKKIDELASKGLPTHDYTPEVLSEEIRQGYELYKNDPVFKNHEKNINNFYENIRVLWNSLYIPHLESYIKNSGSEQPEDQLQKRLGNINKLFDDILERVLFDVEVTIDNVIEDLIMASDVKVETESAVQILTIHKSKGLEYQYVYLPGLEQAMFFKEDEPDVDRVKDEENNFYVAITRPRQKLFCSSAAMRMVNGEMRANLNSLMFLTPDVLSTMNCASFEQVHETSQNSNSAAWENVSISMDEATQRLLAALRI